MTIQSLAWALDQPIPGTAKLVLIALSNHASHITGRVDFDATLIAAEASIREPSLWRYLGALERNGYLIKEIRKAENDKREYWLVLDRDPALAWSWAAQDGERDSDDDEELDRPVKPAISGVPRRALSVTSAFRRDAQDQQRAVVTAPEPGRPDGLVPIIEGSRAFHAWAADFRRQRKPAPYIRSMIVHGKECRGFYMPTLFPAGGEESAA